MRTIRYIPCYTIADYVLWEGDWELIDGLPIAMTPTPGLPHQLIGAEFLNHCLNQLKSQKDNCGDCYVVYETDWRIDDTNVLRPDIAVICDEKGDFISHPPKLLIEISSASTALRDRHVKYEIYQEQGVKYYIIIDAATMTHRVYELRNGAYFDYLDQVFSIHDGCTITLDIHTLLSDFSR